MCGQATGSPPLQLIGMNPQALPPYPRDPVSNSKFASWDYPIGNIERWHAKTSLDQHYAAGKLQPTEYETRMVGIMGATMWSHLVAIFADLPAPGPAYDGKQLLKACHAAQKAQPTSPSVTILLPILLGLTLLIILGVAGPLGFVLSSPVLIVPIIVIPMSVADKYKREAYSAAGKTWFGWWLVEHYLPYHVNCPDGCVSGEPARGRKDPPYFQMGYGSLDHIPDLVDPFVESPLPA